MPRHARGKANLEAAKEQHDSRRVARLRRLNNRPQSEAWGNTVDTRLVRRLLKSDDENLWGSTAQEIIDQMVRLAPVDGHLPPSTRGAIRLLSPQVRQRDVDTVGQREAPPVGERRPDLDAQPNRGEHGAACLEIEVVPPGS